MPRRLRHHMNPFSFRRTVPRPDWSAAFGREAPLEVDLGSGTGDYLIARAAEAPDANLVGLEVRAAFVAVAERRRTAAGAGNVRFLHCNLALSLPGLFDARSVRRFTVLFPDPWFKKRHHKRRMITPDAARAMVGQLADGGEIIIATDQRMAHDWLRAAFEGAPGLVAVPVDAPPSDAPRSAWERHLERIGRSVHRARYVRAGA